MVKKTVLKTAGILVFTLIASAGITAAGGNGMRDNADKGHAHISADSMVTDIISHPAFEGFGERLMPRAGRDYSGVPIARVGSLMPYHNYVDPRVVTGALNRMIDDVNEGVTIFYDIYTDAEKRDDSAKADTGLFFFRGKPGAPFAVICPGGGFSYVGSLHEGFPLAAEIGAKGYNAFVITYRTGGQQRAAEDLAAALSWIFANAKSLGVGTEDYSLWGGSAGARMAAVIGTDGAARYGGGSLPKPAALVIAYTGHSAFSKDDPPTFTVAGERDGIANPAVMERRVRAMADAGIDTEFHIYPDTGHGFGLGTGTAAEGWLNDAVRFWEKYMKE
ncbi:alpha/beta hydrolase [Brucepastera parasyntrophica]|uniref:alpha/beta hydrolase n=1 Tax=Brucepastera parasyntrophica TaxID=2880008 RepID=UPI00210E4484|nr:alpha/beta hydrolase [Brucepastera parasyntrophica]ULQ60446.1 alpha/beta hydrolase [Brucepastera parasyntrophica]